MQPNDRDEAYVTVAEVAKVLKLNPQTVRNWIDQGALPAQRFGRRVRIRRADYERLLSEGLQAGPSAPPPAGPTAEAFWGGEPVGVPELPAATERLAEPSGDGSGAG